MSSATTGQAPGELPVIWDVIDQHLDELGAFWSEWEKALVAPDRTLSELVSSDEERLFAHLEGLVMGGAPVIRERLLPAVADDLDPELVFAAALALLCGGDAAKHLDAVLEALARADDGTRAALIRALELAPLADPASRLAPLLTHSMPALRAAALEVLAFHRADLSRHLPALLEDDDPVVRAAAVRAATGPAGAPLMPALVRALDDPDPAVGQAALPAGLVHGLDPALRRCRDLAAGPEQGDALLLLCLSEGNRALDTLTGALGRPGCRRAALVALGYLGLPETIPGLVEHLQGPPARARLAGEAFCAITGLDLATRGMALATTAGQPEEPVPLTDEDLDADLVPAPEELLPVPDAPAVLSWWEQNRHRFNPGQRYILGVPASMEAYRAALLHAPMRRRHTLALDLAIRTRGALMPRTRTWGRVQIRELEEAAWAEGQAGVAPTRRTARSPRSEEP